MSGNFQRRSKLLALTQADGSNIFFNQIGGGDFLSPYSKLSVPSASSNAFGSVKITTNNLLEFRSSTDTITGVLGGESVRGPNLKTSVKDLSGQVKHPFLTSKFGCVIKNTGSQPIYVGDSSVSESNGYKLAAGKEIPFLNLKLSSVYIDNEPSQTCQASTISI